jgi:two-component sensor histidine kinase
MSEDFSLLDRMPMGAFILSREYSIRFWNLCMEGWTYVSAAEALDRDIRDLFPKFRNPAIAARLETVFAGGPPVIFSYQLHGDLFPSRQTTLVPRVRQCVASSLPSIGGALFAVEDRTDIAAKSREAQLELERREAVERELRRAVDEKDMLMRELNHRVKNNLHMVQNLISLESSSLPVGQARDLLTALEARINSISALHDSLHRLKAGSDIEADEYLASICEHLSSAFAGSPEGPRIRLSVEPLSMPSDQILYLGLAVNELMTNALKYGGKNICLSFAQVPEGGLELSLRDDGPGFASPPPTRPDSLGLRLVSLLAEQMRGSFEADGSKGGFFRLRLPLRACSRLGERRRSETGPGEGPAQ